MTEVEQIVIEVAKLTAALAPDIYALYMSHGQDLGAAEAAARQTLIAVRAEVDRERAARAR